MEKDIIDSWPWNERSPRLNQIKVFEWMQDNLDKKYLFCEVPVGSGKSAIGVTLSRHLSASLLGDSFILTPQRILQEQYEQSFNKSIIHSLYGKSNYQCEKGNGLTCDIGSLLKPKCSSCPHATARRLAQKAPNVVLNYTLALLSFTYTDNFLRRSLMVLDECHTLEDHLTEFTSFEITAHRCEKYGVDFKRCQEMGEAIKWLNDKYLPKLDYAIQNLYSEIKAVEDMGNSQVTSMHISKMREFEQLGKHYESIMGYVDMDIDVLRQKAVLIHDAGFIKFKPLKGQDNFMSLLDPMADQFLFMSSTILNYKAYCTDIGIDPSKAAFISLGSEFDPEKRPVYFIPTAKMNKDWALPENAKGRESMLDAVTTIMDEHAKESGIIHTGNFNIAKWLTQHVEDHGTHDIFHHNPGSDTNRNKVINAFQTSKRPALLISPSITEGLDLIDDRARFAIFAKVPFGFLGDQWIKARMDMSIEWYQRHALIDIIQGCGRIVRSTDDWGSVYILDSSWSALFYRTKHSIPKWWLDAYCSS